MQHVCERQKSQFQYLWNLYMYFCSFFAAFYCTKESQMLQKRQLSKLRSKIRIVVGNRLWTKQVPSELVTETHCMQQQRSYNAANCSALQLRIISKRICMLYKSFIHNKRSLISAKFTATQISHRVPSIRIFKSENLCLVSTQGRSKKYILHPFRHFYGRKIIMIRSGSNLMDPKHWPLTVRKSWLCKDTLSEKEQELKTQL